jgi:serine/threonine protein kinase
VTEAELSDPFGTQNVHSLPPYYSYGLGSAGFRAGREVALHSETTRWVLDGACTHFPLTYHHRLLPAGHRTPKVTPDALDAYVQSWNHHPAIRPLVEARNAATMEVFIVLEYIPFVLREWFFDQADAAPRFMTQLDAATHFLAEKGVVHFDAHGGNIVTDGVDFYLTDFGLGMADSFELNRQERAFLHRHRHYDRGLATCGLLFPLAGAVRRLTDPARKQLEARFGDTGTVTIASNIRQLVDEGLLDLPHSMVDLLEPRIEVIHRVVSFFDALRESVHTARFPDADMQRHLPSLPSARV